MVNIYKYCTGIFVFLYYYITNKNTTHPDDIIRVILSEVRELPSGQNKTPNKLCDKSSTSHNE